MDIIQKCFSFVGDKAIPKLDLFLSESGWLKQDVLEKSAATKVSEFKVYVRTYSNFKYKMRSFSLNEMEAEFSTEDYQLKSLVFKDTSVHKKITFTSRGAILTVVKGQDVVGKNSESIQSVKEPIISISVNGKDVQAPFELESIYEMFTGLSIKYLTEEEIEEEKVNANLWNQLAEELQREGLI